MTSAAVISLCAIGSPVVGQTYTRQQDGGKTGGTVETAVLAFRPRVATRDDSGKPAGRTEPRARRAVERRAAGLPRLVVHDDAAAAASLPDGTAGDADDALVRAIARGSRSAMRTLFMRHQTRVYRFINRIVRDHMQAEDLTSDVFLAVWRRADLFQGRSRVSTWLCGIARHKALTALQTVPPICHDEEVMLTVCDPGPGPEGELQAKDKVAALRRALLGLSPEHRQIIDLVYFRDKSIKEIADMLGIGLNTVKTRTFYARKRLARLMAAAEV
jgi:RNA polymerase sigma-70 factor (ECF subfamily)